MFSEDGKKYLKMFLYLNLFYIVVLLCFLEWSFLPVLIFGSIMGIIYFLLLEQRVKRALDFSKKRAILHMLWGLFLRMTVIVLAVLVFAKMAGLSKIHFLILGFLSFPIVVYLELITQKFKKCFLKKGGEL